MKITKIQLRRLIREEKRKMLEDCGDVHAEDTLPPVSAAPVSASLSETVDPEQEMIVEMEVAQRSLEQVVESVSAAASLCPNCGPGVAVQAPLVEAMVAQAVALQETLQAQLDVVAESTDAGEALSVVDMVTELV